MYITEKLWLYLIQRPSHIFLKQKENPTLT
jgi:hypothetical protein